ncbi:MAG TPA: Ldh family oxidoreductase [Afifellaceae bacterium]|nr:Ldh family oxidoreductase [Afifellaceae bacterium]
MHGHSHVLCVPAERLRRQTAGILAGWGMSDAQAATTAEVLVAADLAGIDSHGVALLGLYEQQIRNGKASAEPHIRVVRELGAALLIDGGGGFGQVPSMLATDKVIEKASAFGLAAAAVRNSNHYGAAGIYARRIAEAGLIGISTSSVWRPAIAPTGGRAAMLGTNPWAFAAPAAANRPFLLDMATSAVAIGKLKLAARAGRDIPDGWAITKAGTPQLRPSFDLVDTLLLPLGGDRLHGGHKGYGLAAMVEILSSVLSGAAVTPLRDGSEDAYDVGHFFLALDPGFFRDDRGAFEADMDRLIEALRATPAADPDIPVLVAGDPEYAREEERRREGIPIPAKLAEEIRGIAERAGAGFLLEAAEV